MNNKDTNQRKYYNSSYSRTNKKKKSSKRRNELNRRTLIKLVVVLLIVFAFIKGVCTLFLYITESAEDPYDPYPVIGIDVSAYQKEIDWKGLEKEGVEFAFIKATEGTTFVDETFEYNWEEANRTGMKVGAYHFLTYTSEGQTQAANFINTVGRKWGMMPPVVDVEFYDEFVDSPPSKEEMYEILDPLLEILEDKYNRKPIIYTNADIYKKYISDKYDEYPVWISSPDEIPDKLSDDREWLFCQFTFSGISPSVAGGTVKVDYNVFNGTKWDFRRYNGK